MKKLLLGLIVALGLAVAVGYLFKNRLALAYAASQTETRTQAELEALIVPELIWQLPEEGAANGPYPLFVQMHGCGGLHLDHLREYASIANQAGYAAVIVSSNAPRGFDEESSLANVCRGKALLGQERAADIMVTLGAASKRGDIDMSNIVLGGWSHGAWTVMDYLSFDREEGLPVGLAEFDGPRPEINAAVLFYPYCGIGNRARVHGWESHNPDVLTLIGTADSIVDHVACQVVFSNLELGAGKSMESHVYEGAEHAFDAALLGGEASLWYNAKMAADARSRVAAFLTSQAVQ